MWKKYFINEITSGFVKEFSQKAGSMSKRMLALALCLTAFAVLNLISCGGTPPNPYVPKNADAYVSLQNSSGVQSSDTTLTEVVGATVRVGVKPYLSAYLDSVVISVPGFHTGVDTAVTIKHFSSDADTQWFNFTFTLVKSYTVTVDIFQGGTKHSKTGIITITGKPVTASMSPPTDSGFVDSLVTFTVTPQGDKPFIYQWFHGSTLLSGKTGVSLVISHRALADSGIYICRVWDKWGDSAFSDPAHLIVIPRIVVITNRKPQISVIGHSTILSFEVCSLTVTAADPDSGDSLRYSVLKAPTGYSFSNNLFTWAPYTGYLGADSMKIDTAIFMVVDNGQPRMSDTQKVFIIVSAKIFQPDSIKGIAPVSRYNGSFVFKWNKSANADEYAIYRSKDTTGFTQYGATQDTSFTNNIKDTAFYYYVVATNSKKSSPPSARIHSTDINNAPKWSHAAINVNINEGSSFSFDCTDSCRDTNSDAIAYQLFAAGGVNDSVIGSTWRYTPSYSDAGVKTVKIKATDGIDSSFLTITVTVVNVSRPPQPQPQSLSTKSNAPLSITLFAFDPDGDAVTSWTIDTATTHGTSVLTNASQPGVTYTPAAGYIGTDYFTFKASVGALSSTYSAKVSIRIDTNNIAPAISQKLTAKTLNKGDSLTLTVTINSNAFPAPAYCWYKQGSLLDSTMTNSWKSGLMALTDSGLYYVIVKNAAGRDSSGAKVTMQFAPTISPKLAATTTVNEGAATALSVSVNVDATPAPAYQWYFNGQAIPNAKAASYSKTWAITDTGTYLVTVTNNAGKDTSFTKLIVKVAPGAPTLTFPSANATGVAVNPTLTWNAVPGALTYRVQVSTASNFATTIVDDSTLTVASDPIGPLANGSQYYWRVNAKNSVGPSGWTTGTFTTIKKFALTVTTSNGTVATSVNSNPATSPFDSSTVVTVTANPAAGYHFASWSLDLTGTTNPTTIVMTGPKSITANFTINAPPAPTLIGPISNMVSPADTICWWGTASTATSYGVQVSTNKSLTSFAVNDSGLGTTYDSVKGLATSTKYYWRAGATNLGGTTWSSVDSFITVIHWTWVDGNASLTQFAQVGSNLLAAGNGNGIMLSGTNGASWGFSNTGLANLNVEAFAVDGSIAYAGASSGSGVVFRSNDFGALWTRMNLDTTLNVQAMTACNGYVFAGTSDSGVYVSSDSGKTWSTRNGGLISLSVQSLKSTGSYIFLANNEGVHALFYNAGPSNSWTVSRINGDAVTLAVSGNDLYTYVVGDSIYRSKDNASTWTGMHPPAIPGTVYLAAKENEIFFASLMVGVAFCPNYGTGWSGANQGITIHGHPNMSGIGIFGNYVIAANDQGLYRSPLP